MRKKTRVRRNWSVDYDYMHKLSADEQAFLEKFTDEYYRCDLGDDPLHDTEELRKKLYDSNNASIRDIFTANPQEVTKHREAVPNHRPSIKCRFYFETDYRLNSSNPETFMVELIDWMRRGLEDSVPPCACPRCTDDEMNKMGQLILFPRKLAM